MSEGIDQTCEPWIAGVVLFLGLGLIRWYHIAQNPSRKPELKSRAQVRNIQTKSTTTRDRAKPQKKPATSNDRRKFQAGVQPAWR